ncbi:hypothetical protein ABZS66_49515 [Dactylosporangium sp. NPDC005572]|uniref:hypothetical protein n=1 Tax=Dactylosporangium sp. NPDC005572 TaxID=3156889 RepID=UPI0033A51763
MALVSKRSPSTATLVGMRTVGVVAVWLLCFAGKLIVDLLIVAAVACIPAGCAFLVGYDRDEALRSHHGVVTVRECREAGTSDSPEWRCRGSFWSDDREIQLPDVEATFGKEPGEQAEGWVRDGETKRVRTSVTPAWQANAVTVGAAVIAGVGVIVGVVDAARTATNGTRRFRSRRSASGGVDARPGAGVVA